VSYLYSQYLVMYYGVIRGLEVLLSCQRPDQPNLCVTSLR
jgi:hypothetical protein